MVKFIQLSMSLWALTFLTTGSAQLAYLEQQGLLVIEPESVENIPVQWNEEMIFNDFSQDSYHRYDGDNQFNNPGNALIEINIQIQNPGTYLFRWRNLIAEGTSTTDSNDSWLKINANAYYGLQGNNSIVCPKGYDPNQNNCPVELDDDGDVTPAGSGSGGWFKIYRSGGGLWSWSTRTSDSDSHEIYARFDTAGLYTFEISGRSKNHAIDRIVLNRLDYPADPLDLSLPESPMIDADLIFIDGFE